MNLFVLLCLSLALGRPQPAVARAATHPAPRVAVLSEPGMPTFMADSALYPSLIVSAMRRCGLRAEEVTTAGICSPRFSAATYAALVLPYGNTFPRPIAEPVARFHRAGGSIISFGVPFTHPCVPAGPVGWSMTIGAGDIGARSQESPHGGAYFMRIDRHGGPAVWSGMISARVPVTGGQRLHVSAWVRSEGGFGPEDAIYVRFHGPGGRFLGQSGPAIPPHATGWTEVSGNATAPQEARSADVCIALFKPGRLDVDDVRLRLPSGGSLLRDGGFEGTVPGLWLDTGHVEGFRGHDSTGAGGVRIVEDPDGFAAPGAARWLGMVRSGFGPIPPNHLMAVADFPEDEVVEIAGPTRKGRLLGASTALIRHHCSGFTGAVDLYASTQSPLPTPSVRLAVCGAARVLRERRLLTEAAMRAIQAKGSRWTEPARPLVSLPRGAQGGEFIFPKPKPPLRNLLLVDLTAVAGPDRLTVAALQGLLNRPVPRVYVQDEWTDDMRGWGFRLSPIEPGALLTQHGHAATGVVVYDPDLPATADLAVTLCGTRGWLPVQASQLVRVGPRGSLLRLPIAADLRGRWRTEAQVFEYALTHVRRECTDRVLCHEKQMEPLSPAAVDLAATLVDYVVQQRVFSFHLNRSWSQADRRVAEAILASYPANTPIIGHFGPEANGAPNLANEVEIVELASRFAKFYVFYVSPNGSVHAGFPTRPLRQRHPVAPVVDSSRAYITPYLSDGDSPTTFYQGRTRWADPARGTVPINWSLGPTALELCPRVMEWFYSHATPNDCFVAACTGAGYIYPHVYGANITGRQAAVREYLRMTDRQMRRADLTIAHIHHMAGCSDSDLDRFAGGVPAIKGILADYGRTVPDYRSSLRTGPRGTPIFHAITTFDPPRTGTQAQFWVRQILDTVPATRPAWIHFFAVVWFSNPSDVAAALKGLPADYTPVRADAMAAMYRTNRRAEHGMVHRVGATATP